MLAGGAGVVGNRDPDLGAQTLVRDIVSGVFYLLADSFRVGEYVQFGEVRGTVEGNSLRFLRIRHHRGAVYTVPFGEIKWLVNHSRDWAVMKVSSFACRSRPTLGSSSGSSRRLGWS